LSCAAAAAQSIIKSMSSGVPVRTSIVSFIDDLPYFNVLLWTG
jgi:hypothetical protein